MLGESSRFQLLDYNCVVYFPLLEGYRFTFTAEFASFPNFHSSLLEMGILIIHKASFLHNKKLVLTAFLESGNGRATYLINKK